MATKNKRPAFKAQAKPSNTPAAKPVVANTPVVAKPAVAASVTVNTVAAKPAVTVTKTTTTATKPAVKKVTAKPAAVNPVATKPAASKAAPAKKAGKKDDKKDNKKDDKKDDKKPKVEKVKMERDSFTMPKEEYAHLALLKARLTSMGHPVKKSELLRAGIKLLAAMSDNTLKTTMEKIPAIKTGRPKK